MAKSLRILCVHGAGDHRSDLSWQDQWKDAIGRATRCWAPDATLTYDFVMYDDLFEKEEITFAGMMEALAKLVGSGIQTGLEGLFGRRRGFLGTVRAEANAARKSARRNGEPTSLARFGPHVFIRPMATSNVSRVASGCRSGP